MGQINKVLKSINAPGNSRCVDIFIRPDGTFGFEEFRRDVEDPSGWFPIGDHKARVFDTEKNAFKKAKELYPWIAEKNLMF